MLDINKSMFIDTYPLDVASTVTALEEGTALVYVMENGKGKVKASTGAASEIFAGVAVSRATTPTVAPMVEELTIPATAPYTVTLARLPVGAIGVVLVDGETRTVLAAIGSAPTAAQYTRTGKDITVHADNAGAVLKVVYSYTLTHQEAVLKFNFDAFASVDLAVVPVVGAVYEGVVYTTFYDNTVDWDSFGAQPVKLAADGKFTLGGSGASVNAQIVEAPSANSNGFLGIRLLG